MSGIYIKGMEMPKNCYECPIAQGYSKPAYCGLNGSIPKLWKEFDDALEKEIKPDFCPLISVPDHGRLIDTDKLESHHGWISKQKEKNIHQLHITFVYNEDIVNAPTIIPTNKEIGK